MFRVRPMFESAEEASRFFAHQALRTSAIRRELYRRAGIQRMKSILDAGCGTGEITSQLREITTANVTGVDIEEIFIKCARSNYGGVDFRCSDCASLPYEDCCFDMVTFHFFLMWAQKPSRVIGELLRVLKRGGVLLACAEPDYGGIIEYPENREFRKAEEEALRARGADTKIGRKLGFLLREAGLSVNQGVFASVIEGRQLVEDLRFMKDFYLRDFTQIMDEKRARTLIEKEIKIAARGKVMVPPFFGRSQERIRRNGTLLIFAGYKVMRFWLS